MSLIDILIVYLVFRVKQVACDFVLQTGWMAVTKNRPFSLKDMTGARALALHAGIHAAGTLLVMLWFAPYLWFLAVADFFMHAAIDKSKALIMTKTGWTYKDAYYWWAFGVDQELHNFTHLIFIIIMVIASGTVLH